MEEFVWTDARIRWMSDAAKKGKFYYLLAERISAYLPPTSRIFCAGGGLGDLAIWISYHVEQVTAIENDAKAIAVLRARCPHNVVVLLGDVLSYSPDRLYDALVLYNVGGVEQVLPVVRELSSGKTFLIQSRETPQEEAIIDELIDALENAGVPMKYDAFEQEHIQPFRSWEDAKSYFLFTWNRELTEEELRSILEETDDRELPFVYREKKKLGMILFDAANPALKKPIA